LLLLRKRRKPLAVGVPETADDDVFDIVSEKPTARPRKVATGTSAGPGKFGGAAISPPPEKTRTARPPLPPKPAAQAQPPRERPPRASERGAPAAAERDRKGPPSRGPKPAGRKPGPERR
jgi:hypothetical protein